MASGSRTDHDLVVGTGGIPRADWELLARTLREIDFRGAAVFRIRPYRLPQIGWMTRKFFDGLM